MAYLTGIAFPFTQGVQSFPAKATDEEVIKASVIQIVTTGIGERIMRPDFGCNALMYVFENLSDDMSLDIEREIRRALARWEPRVSVDMVDVREGSDTEPGQILVSIFYTIIATNIQQKVVLSN